MTRRILIGLNLLMRRLTMRIWIMRSTFPRHLKSSSSTTTMISSMPPLPHMTPRSSNRSTLQFLPHRFHHPHVRLTFPRFNFHPRQLVVQPVPAARLPTSPTIMSTPRLQKNHVNPPIILIIPLGVLTSIVLSKMNILWHTFATMSWYILLLASN
jgi:hypothetical protein